MGRPLGLKLIVVAIVFCGSIVILAGVTGFTVYSFSGMSDAKIKFMNNLFTLGGASYLLLGWGLWCFKNWARVLLVIMYGITVLFSAWSLILDTHEWVKYVSAIIFYSITVSYLMQRSLREEFFT